MMRPFTALLAAAMLTASAAAASQFSDDQNVANAALKKGDYIAAILAMAGEIDTERDQAKVLRLMERTKDFGPQLVAQIRAVSGPDWRPYEQAAEAATGAGKIGALTPTDRDEAIKGVADNFAAGVVAKKIDADISGPELLNSLVDEPEFNRQILEDSIARLKGVTISDGEFSVLTDFIAHKNGSVELTKILSAALPKLTFEPAALKDSVQHFDSEFAAKKLEQSTIKVFVDAQSSDGLIPLDLKTALSSRDNLVLTDTPSQAEVTVTVRQLALDVEKLDESNRTVSYAQYQVNFAAAVLLMPQNATYQFEYSQGGYEYEYAFDVALVRKDGSKSDRVVRDKGKLEWSSCKNMRIVNVFGGSQPAGFMANADMRNLCSDTPGHADQGDVRSQIVERLASEIDGSEMHK